MNAMVEFPPIQRARAFDPVIAANIVEAIAEGVGLNAVCQEQGISRSSVTRWLQNVDTFATSYAQARQQQLDCFTDEVIEISDDAVGKDAAGVQAAKLRADNRKWLLSKLRAEVFGDKLDVTSKGEALAAPSHMVDARVQSIVMQAARRMQEGLDPSVAGLLE